MKVYIAEPRTFEEYLVRLIAEGKTLSTPIRPFDEVRK